MKSSLNVLIAPLNWGLGHASRVIPIIHELHHQEVNVILAVDGRPYELLKKEFPRLRIIRLQGYDIRYQQQGSFTTTFIRQFPKLIRSYFFEKAELSKITDAEDIDVVISDNRYGLSDKRIYSVFITHQTCVMMPERWKWLEKIVYRINRKLIEQYNECWIPDWDTDKNLSGNLTRKYPLPWNAKFIGPLSRMSILSGEKKYDLLMLLSGPEPQRTILEDLLRSQSEDYNQKILMVRGIPESTARHRVNDDFEIVGFMGSEELNKAIASSTLVICRSGYSTVMDLALMKKKAMFIPTPGQTEQEYLASYFMKRRIAYFEPQESFNLKRAIERSKEYSGFNFELPASDIRSHLESSLNNASQFILKRERTLAENATA